MLPDEGALRGMRASEVGLDVVRRKTVHASSSIVESSLEDTCPEGTKSHEIAVLGLDEIRINGIVVVTDFRCNANATIISPGAWLHAVTDSKADGGLLGTKPGDGIVAEVLITNFGAVRGLYTLRPLTKDLSR